ncbi:MAG: PspC domain-containing protein [Bacillota bacterium]|nr:PspC domain-containing protein [Bacillota bacterium]
MLRSGGRSGAASRSRRAFPSRRDRVIVGAVARAAEALGVDPTIVRLIWVLGSVFGAGAVVYLAALMLIPWSRSRR